MSDITNDNVTVYGVEAASTTFDDQQTHRTEIGSYLPVDDQAIQSCSQEDSVRSCFVPVANTLPDSVEDCQLKDEKSSLGIVVQAMRVGQELKWNNSDGICYRPNPQLMTSPFLSPYQSTQDCLAKILAVVEETNNRLLERENERGRCSLNTKTIQYGLSLAERQTPQQTIANRIQDGQMGETVEDEKRESSIACGINPPNDQGNPAAAKNL